MKALSIPFRIFHVIFLLLVLVSLNTFSENRSDKFNRDERTALSTSIKKCMTCHHKNSNRRLILDNRPISALKSLRQQYQDPKNAVVNPNITIKMLRSGIHGKLTNLEKLSLLNYLNGGTLAKTYEAAIDKALATMKISKMPVLDAESEKLRTLIPKIDNPILSEIIKNSVIYDNVTDMPTTYQDDGRGSLFPTTNIQGLNKLSNNNGHFFHTLYSRSKFLGLLGSGFGLHKVPKDHIKTFKFAYIPMEGNARSQLDWFKEVFPKDGRHFLAWEFPNNTVVGEVVILKRKDTNTYYPIDVRVRWIVGEGDHQADVYRPYPTAEDLAVAIENRWQDANARRAVAALRDSSRLIERQVFDDYNYLGQGKGHVFSRTGGIDRLPHLSKSRIHQLLTNKVYRSSLNRPWKTSTDGQLVSHAPTTDQAFHIVPKNYEAHTVAINSKSCVGCHSHGAITLFELHPTAPTKGAPLAKTSGYGSIYGNRPYLITDTTGQPELDENGYPLRDTSKGVIFSIHPFSSQAVEIGTQEVGDVRYRNGRPAFSSYFLNNKLIKLGRP